MLLVPVHHSFSIGGNDSFTKLLLHCDGADGSTTFIDSSPSAQTVVVNDGAQVDTAQSKFGGGSLLLDGVNDFIRLGGEADFAFGTGDFTIDFWVRLNAIGIAQSFYDSRPVSVQGLYPTILVQTDNTLRFFTNSVEPITGTTTLSTGQFYHIALARAGTSTKLFLNGVQEGSTYSDSNNYLNGANRPTIGTSGLNNTVLEVNGWMDEVRISKGIARWTENFGPPVVPYDAG